MIGHLQTITEAVHALRYEPITVGERAEAYEAIKSAALAMAVPGSDGERPSYPALWMAVARLMATRSTCPRLAVGAVIVSEDNRILTTGYNGSAPGKAPHCTEVGCLIEPETSRCKRTVHAERNAVNQAAKLGVSIAGGTLYVSHQPCPECLVSLTTTGLRRIVYADPYPWPAAIADELATLARDAGIEVMREGVIRK